jgi:hypothetical protein
MVAANESQVQKHKAQNGCLLTGSRDIGCPMDASVWVDFCKRKAGYKAKYRGVPTREKSMRERQRTQAAAHHSHMKNHQRRYPQRSRGLSNIEK